MWQVVQFYGVIVQGGEQVIVDEIMVVGVGVLCVQVQVDVVVVGVVIDWFLGCGEVVFLGVGLKVFGDLGYGGVL